MKRSGVDNSAVRQLDLKRFLGKWYEIARFDHVFERGLVGVTAEYKLRPDGRIDVLNSGRVGTLDGKLRTARGKAKVPDPAEPGRLKVSFFWWFYSEYNVLELDQENYSYALVGGRSDKYLWILSRMPLLPDATVDWLRERARVRGYDPSRLMFVAQK